MRQPWSCHSVSPVIRYMYQTDSIASGRMMYFRSEISLNPGGRRSFATNVLASASGPLGAASSSTDRGGGGARFSKTEDESTSVGVSDRKSTRLNSSHVRSSYAVFCLKKQ